MNGEGFISFLKRINYQKAAGLDGNSFDWMFDHESAVPLLDWLCDEVGTDNFLLEAELQKYRALEGSDEGVLEGKQLEEALNSIVTVDEDSLSEETLREEIVELESELRRSKERKDLLVQQRNKLSLHHTSVTDKLYHMSGLENEAKVEYKHCLEESHTDNAKLTECVDSLCEAVSSLTDRYTASSARHHQPAESGDSNGQLTNGAFLSQLPLDQYHDTEEKFSQVLTAYTKKLFFEGISEIAGCQNEKTRYDFLEISKPETLLVHGEAEQNVLEDCKELARHKAFYPRSEASRIDAKLAQKSLEAALSFIQKKLQLLKDSPYPKEIKQLREVLEERERVFGVIRHDEALVMTQELPELLRESANSWLTNILCGDYNLKISRQNYFTANQDKLIEELIGQRSRNEYLTMAYEKEDRSHRETHRLLTALNMLLKKNTVVWADRMNLLKEPVLGRERHGRNTIDSRDKHLARFSKVLGVENGEKSQLFITHSQLTSKMAALNHQVSSLNSSLSAAHSNHDHTLKQLEKSVEKSCSLVYSGSSTSGGHPTLSSQPISDALTQINTMLKKLEQVVLDIRKDMDHKKKILKTDSLQCVERELFVYFHNDHATLRRVLDDLEARYNAHMVQ